LKIKAALGAAEKDGKTLALGDSYTRKKATAHFATEAFFQMLANETPANRLGHWTSGR
jgi:hypothetical protein